MFRREQIKETEINEKKKKRNNMDAIFKQMMTEKGGDKINEKGKNKWWPRLLIKIIMDKLSIDTDNCKMPI